MRGLRCRNCDGRRDVQAYITAYDIAKKHGYTGTEAEWIASIGTVFVAKVVTQTPGAWTCDTSYEYLVAQKTAGKIIALAAEDTIAWLVESEDDLIFATLPFDDATYREYILDDEDTGTWTTRASGSVFSDYIPASVQPTKHAGMTCEVGLDENQQLWAEGYKKPYGGIPATDIANEVTGKINLAPVLFIPIVKTGNVYDVDTSSIDLRGYNSVPLAIMAGADVRAVILSGNAVEMVPFSNSPDPNILIFAAPEYDTFGSGTATNVYYIWDATQPHVTRVVKTLGGELPAAESEAF